MWIESFGTDLAAKKNVSRAWEYFNTSQCTNWFQGIHPEMSRFTVHFRTVSKALQQNTAREGPEKIEDDFTLSKDSTPSLLHMVRITSYQGFFFLPQTFLRSFIFFSWEEKDFAQFRERMGAGVIASMASLHSSWVQLYWPFYMMVSFSSSLMWRRLRFLLLQIVQSPDSTTLQLHHLYEWFSSSPTLPINRLLSFSQSKSVDSLFMTPTWEKNENREKRECQDFVFSQHHRSQTTPEA